MIKHSFLTATLAIILFACNNDGKPELVNENSPEMTQDQKDERNKAIVLKCISAYAAKDSNYLLAQSVNDVINIHEGRPVRGNDSARIILRQAFSMPTDYKPANQIAMAENNYVFVFQYVDITDKKGKNIWRAKQVEIFKFNDDGKLIFHNACNEDLGPNDVKVPF